MSEKIKNILKRTIKIYGEHNLGVYAGNATLFIITAVFPMLMLIIAIVNMLPGYSPKDVTEFLFQFIPDLSSIKSLVNGMVSNLQSQSSGLLASVAALTTLWSASAGVTAMQKGLKELSNVPSKSVKDKLWALLFTLLYVLLIPLILIFQVLQDSIINVAGSLTAKIGLENMVDQIATIMKVSNVVTIVLAFIILLLTYTYLPGQKRSVKQQIPGTIFLGVMFVVFTKLFSIFIPKFYNSSGLYGSLASLFLALLWLRFVLMILFLGGALNTAIAEEKGQVS